MKVPTFEKKINMRIYMYTIIASLIYMTLEIFSLEAYLVTLYVCKTIGLCLETDLAVHLLTPFTTKFSRVHPLFTLVIQNKKIILKKQETMRKFRNLKLACCGRVKV